MPSHGDSTYPSADGIFGPSSTNLEPSLAFVEDSPEVSWIAPDASNGLLPPAGRPRRRREDSGFQRSADRFDAALDDFLGEDVALRSSNEALRMVYGDVFDPEQRQAELVKQARTRPPKAASGDNPNHAAFAWDADALDEPIDLEDVRRRIGTRGSDSDDER